MKRIIAALAGSSIALVLGAAGDVAAAGNPVIGYWTDTNVVVADRAGETIATFRNFDEFSFESDTLAGRFRTDAGDRHIVGFSIAAHERVFKIRHAHSPVVTADGRRVAFFASVPRDDVVQSVWMRMGDGRKKVVARFKAAPHLPGIPHGIEAGGVPLTVAVDKDGRKMAIGYGAEDIRQFDVWVVDVATKKAKRMTRGEDSLLPSLTPNGRKLAVMVERDEEDCGGFYSTQIRVMSTVTEDKKMLTPKSCDLFYTSPRWIDNTSLLAVRVARTSPGVYDFDMDIVKIDATTGQISDVVTEGNDPCCLTTSPRQRMVAYPYSDIAGFSVLDLDDGTPLDFPPDNYQPHLSGEHFLRI